MASYRPDLQFHTVRLCSHTSSLPFQRFSHRSYTSRLRIQTLDTGFQTSSIASYKPNLRYDTFSLRYQTFGLPFQRFSLESYTSRQRSQTLDIGFQTSSIATYNSNLRFHTVRLRTCTSRIQNNPKLSVFKRLPRKYHQH